MFNTVHYNPANHYWQIGAASQVWSSAAASFVPLTNASYTAWLAAGNLATPVSTQAQITQALSAAYPAGVPGTATSVPQQSFIGMFTPAEQAAIIAAAPLDANMLWMAQIVAMQPISLTDPAIIAGINALAANGVITPARAAAILAP